LSAETYEQSLVSAHQKMLATKDLQFEFSQAPVPPPPPDWLINALKAIGKAFEAAAPFLQWIFWGGLALVALLIAWFLARDIVRIRLEKSGRPLDLSKGPEAWRPSPERAKALLSDADALADQGRYAEAVHLILVRSVDDFAAHRPGSVKPALTSRDLAQLETMPTEARTAFAHIAQVVERSLFGGQDVDQDRFAACRHAYHDFALAERWT
jgi:hypothetical protein